MNYKEEAKTWIDANVHDGENRKGCVSDYATFNPDDLQELIDDLLDDIIPKALEAQRSKCDDAWWDNEGKGPATISRAILNASIGDSQDKPNPKWTKDADVL